MKWRRAARVVIACAAAVFAVAVGLSLRSRTHPNVEAPLPRTDPKAVVESAGGETFRVNRDKEEVRVRYEKLLTYAEGASKMLGVTVTTERSGRDFTVTAREGQIGTDESTIELVGAVKVVASDGMVLTTEHATYTSDGVARAPGMAEFTRGRTSGSGLGLTYDKNQDILTILAQAAVHMDPDAAGAGGMDVTAGALEFRRNEKSIRFDGSMKATRPRETLEADTAVAHLTADEEHLDAVELRGNSRITSPATRAGGLQGLSGRDIDLRYAAGGQVIEHATVNGDAVIQMAGEGKQTGRQIVATTIEVALAPDGTTPTSLIARENVRLTMPGEANGVTRTIQAQTLDSQGDDRRGLTAARFEGDVQFAERSTSVNRLARSAVLDVDTGPGFSALDDARFARGVRFADGGMTATAALARYVLSQGVLQLTGSEPGALVPHIVNEQIAVDAVRIDVTLEGPEVAAKGAVKSVLQAAKSDPAKGKSSAAKLPSMLKQDQPVNVTADNLEYQGRASRAVYTGGAQLWQADTVIKAPQIVIDSEKGDLSADGTVATASVMVDEGKDGKKERTRTIGASKTFRYDDAERRATYTGEAHLNGPQGDLAASRIELYLKPSGDELDRVEAYEKVLLKADARKTDGARLTYFGDEGRYVVTGAPVTILDECGRETTGSTLTFFKSTDRIVVDGAEQIRTQTKSNSNCPGT